MHRSILAIGLASLLGLAACGDTVGEQAILGSAAGVGVAAVTGSSLAAGAAIGAGANVAACQFGVANCR